MIKKAIIILLIIIACAACSKSTQTQRAIGTEATSTQSPIPTNTNTPEPSNTPTPEIPTQTEIILEVNEQNTIISNLDKINPEILKIQLNYFSGGAGSCYGFGQSEICEIVDNGTLSLYIGGIYSTLDQEEYFE